MGARVAIALGGALGVAASCLPSGAFSCREDADCALALQPGVCADGHCAYPDGECDSGFAFPAGAPEALAGQCAGGVGTTSGPPAHGDSSDDTDEGAGSDTMGTTAGLASTGATAGESSGTGTGGSGTTGLGTTGAGTSSTGSSDTGVAETGCEPTELVQFVVDDTFARNGSGCPGPGCDDFNYGETQLMDLTDSDATTSVMLLRFEAFDPMPLEVESISLRMVLTREEDAVLERGASIRVAAISTAYPWVEGTKDAEVALPGDSSWDEYDVGVGPWPDAGPPAAIVGRTLGGLDAASLGNVGALTDVELDHAALGDLFAAGQANSLIVEVTGVPPGAVFGFAAEAGVEDPRLVVTHCD